MPYTNDFLANTKDKPQPPANVKEALELVVQLMKKHGDIDLCMTAARMQGKYAVSQDASVLEEIIIGLAAMIREMKEPSPQVMIPRGPQGLDVLFAPPPDVLYALPVSNGGAVTLKQLIDGFGAFLGAAAARGGKELKKSAIQNYQSYIRKVFKVEELDAEIVDLEALVARLVQIWPELDKREDDYGTGAKNVKSAVSALLRYLEELMRAR